jgi:alkylhydroperoxidase family enzyme
MARIRGVGKPGDWPGEMDADTRKGFDELFAFVPDAEFTGRHFGYAIPAAQSPWLALHIARLTSYVARDMAWSKRVDLRELALQTLNTHFKCDFSFESHVEMAKAAGVTTEMQAAIPQWRTSPLFDDEQRLVIEYTYATVTGDVPDELFARVAGRYGEKGAIEFTTVVATFSFWAMLINAARPGSIDNP